MPGRGGFGGGARGGGRMKGPAGLDWEIKYDISWKPEETWPKMNPPITARPRPTESLEILRYRTLRDQIRESPLYTVRGNPRVHKPDAAFSRHARGEDDIPHMSIDYAPVYNHRYHRPKRLIPKLDTRPYILKFIPQELWTLLGPEYANAKDSDEIVNANRKKLKVAQDTWRSQLEMLNNEDDAYDGNDGLDGEGGAGAEDGDNLIEDMDDDFEDQEDGEDAEGDDYNAERYFDNGEDDDGDFGGDDGGGDYGGED